MAPTYACPVCGCDPCDCDDDEVEDPEATLPEDCLNCGMCQSCIERSIEAAREMNDLGGSD